MSRRITQITLVICFLLFTTVLANSATDVYRRAERLEKRAGDIRHHHQQQQQNSSPEPVERRQDGKKFLTEKTRPFEVDGSKIPLVDFDVGESYAGLMPISGDADETRKLFFWFWPSVKGDAPKEIAIWFNGGPGCSSLIGLLSENGPFLWQEGTEGPTPNTYDWRNLTNVVWVEQPVGVGYTEGKVDIKNEEELAKEFVGFYTQFMKTFDLQAYDIYLTGESYAGYYLPYIGAEFINVDSPDMPLTGIHINDPIIGTNEAAQVATVVPYVQYWNNILYINQTTMDKLASAHKTCGYEDLLATYLTYPPPQHPFPAIPDPTANYNDNTQFADPCDPLSIAYEAAVYSNPCLNIYRIADMCPHLESALGEQRNQGEDKAIYFNRSDVKQILHVAESASWGECTGSPGVFVPVGNNTDGGDQSAPPALNGVLTKVIEKTGRVIIGSGGLDMLLNTNGTLLSIQNMTWNGMQGFQEYPGKDFFSPYHEEWNPQTLASSGNVGTWGSERGLTFYYVQLAGHMVPGNAPGPSYRVLEVLLGRVDNLGSTEPFTTQSGNAAGGGGGGGGLNRNHAVTGWRHGSNGVGRFPLKGAADLP